MIRRAVSTVRLPSLIVVGALAVAACTSAARTLDEAEELSVDVCDPEAGPFTIDINNPYLPYAEGQVSVLEGPDGSRTGRVRITVLADTEVIAGVTTRVVEEREWIDDDLVEISRNFVAQASDGTVCYFGEDVDDYSNGALSGHAGAWRASEKGYRPGILMPADPQPGTSHKQEIAPGVAEDASVIVAVGATYTVPAGAFEDTVETMDVNPLTGGKDSKRYGRGVGLILDEKLVLISFES